ncbi:secretion system protein E [Candidatus Pacearchaeota archaeon CG10_big_fil_rev_8_21_14_0_10_31_24]|nr:MAG: secretion system protein E [Candidatus Pacearchaeota archaeon CG10_big_fil_rev_8_21_14_0_10_31_24]
MVVPIITTPSIPALTRVDDKKKIDVRYMLIAPYTSAHIYWDEKIHEIVYEIEEPILNDYEKSILDKLEAAVLELINVNVAIEKTVEATTEYLDKTARLLIDELNLKVAPESYNRLFYYLYRDFIGLNEVDPLLHDYFIEDIECNGVGFPVYIIHRVYRNIKTSLQYNDLEKLGSFVEKLAQRTGRYISYAQPLLDGSLPDGSRVNASYTKDVTSRGPTFTIRKFTKIPWTPTQLINMKAVSPEMLAYFWILLQYKSNILIAGGTGSGKTTLLNALAFFIPPEARVVSIEDTRELTLPRENWLPAVARPSIGIGKVGEVDLFALLKSSFRQIPDYIIVGEVRGKEAFVLFQGMASGHASISTMHADSVDTLIRRLQTPPIELSPTLVNSLDCVVVATHAMVKQHETRRLREIVEIISVNKDGTALVNTPMIWDATKDVFYFKKKSKVFEKIALRNGIEIDELQKEFQTRTKLLYELYKRKIFQFEEIGKIVNDYYKNPLDVLVKYNIT